MYIRSRVRGDTRHTCSPWRLGGRPRTPSRGTGWSAEERRGRGRFDWSEGDGSTVPISQATDCRERGRSRRFGDLAGSDRQFDIAIIDILRKGYGSRFESGSGPHHPIAERLRFADRPAIERRRDGIDPVGHRAEETSAGGRCRVRVGEWKVPSIHHLVPKVLLINRLSLYAIRVVGKNRQSWRVMEAFHSPRPDW